MKVYITKYALTKGVFEITASNIGSEGMIKDVANNYNYYLKGDWYENIEDAKKDAEQRRRKKIISLQKQIDKLNKLKF